MFQSVFVKKQQTNKQTNKTSNKKRTLQPSLGFWNKSQFSALFNLLVSFQWCTEAATTSAYNFIKKDTLAQVFSCEFCEVLKNTFSTEHLRATASG